MYANVTIAGEKAKKVDPIDGLYRLNMPKLDLVLDKSLREHNAFVNDSLFTTKEKSKVAASFNYSLSETKDKSVASGDDTSEGLTIWMKNNVKDRMVNLDGQAYYVSSCALAPSFVAPLGYQISSILQVDMFYCNKFPYETNIPRLTAPNSGDQKKMLGNLLKSMYDVEFAIHFTYFRLLIKVAIKEISGIRFFEVVKFINETYVTNMKKRLTSSNNMEHNKIMESMLDNIIKMLNKAYSELSNYYIQYRRLDVNIFSGCYDAVDDYTNMMIEIAESSMKEVSKQISEFLGGTKGKGATKQTGASVADALLMTQQFTKDLVEQIEQFSVYVNDLVKNLRATSSGDTKTNLQKTKKIFELFVLILNGLDHLDLNMPLGDDLNKVRVIMNLLKGCKSPTPPSVPMFETTKTLTRV